MSSLKFIILVPTYLNMSLFGKLGDDLMKVPKLEASGTNWVVYKDRFLWSVDARGLLEHVDGSEREPVCPVKP